MQQSTAQRRFFRRPKQQVRATHAVLDSATLLGRVRSARIALAAERTEIESRQQTTRKRRQRLGEIAGAMVEVGMIDALIVLHDHAQAAYSELAALEVRLRHVISTEELLALAEQRLAGELIDAPAPALDYPTPEREDVKRWGDDVVVEPAAPTRPARRSSRHNRTKPYPDTATVVTGDSASTD